MLIVCTRTKKCKYYLVDMTSDALEAEQQSGFTDLASKKILLQFKDTNVRFSQSEVTAQSRIT